MIIHLVRMTNTQPPPDAIGADLLKSLLALEHAASSELAHIEEKLPELRRQARAKPRRRGGKGSVDSEKYRLGSSLTLLGFAGVDDMALLGFFACGDRALQWLAQVRLDRGPMTFAEAVSAALTDPARAEWCRSWGLYRRRLYKKAIYDASVTAFIESGRTGANEKWRGQDITADQIDIIEDICEAARLPPPTLATRGEAFQWIYEKGGNPAYWQAPELPAEWKD
ncbi:hypothetical protein [Altericroceibacterium endophyticum]|uniref:Uncharacterized protein n=1 Tax=Altericroceibacterium endophyticum TaxID=1808508 RepID=A0A6I4T6B6_9SPHN|nr:hypothetical protein [Altericroceibacterium endophyticum]MXO65959.1 hypothetical protein [Altericroceibacterium endophyticum]